MKQFKNKEYNKSAITLEAFLRKKSVLPRTAFQKLGKKEGKAPGFLAQDADANEPEIKGASERRYVMKRDGISLTDQHFLMEYLVAGVYQRMLYNRAPNIELVTDTPDPKSKKVAMLFRSEFLDNFKCIAAIEEEDRASNNFEKLQTIIGFPKVVAACVISGEGDYHANNLGVIERSILDAAGNETGQIERIAVKIDHGGSGYVSFTEPRIRRHLRDIFVKKSDIYQHIGCPLEELRDAFEQMGSISDAEVEALVQSRAHKLKHVLNSIQDKQIIEQKSTILKKIDTAATELVSGIVRHLKFIRDDMPRILKIMTLLGRNDSQWMKGGWIYNNPHIDEPINKLLGIVLDRAATVEELNNLEKVIEEFYKSQRHHVSTTLVAGLVPEELFPMLDILEEAERWEDLYNLQLRFSKGVPLLQSLRFLSKLKLEVHSKRLLLENPNLETDYQELRSKRIQAEHEVPRASMRWLIAEHTEVACKFDKASDEVQLRTKLLSEDPQLSELYHRQRRFLTERKSFLESQIENEDMIIEILFYPFTDEIARHDKSLLSDIFAENPRLHQKYDLKHFVQAQPDKVIKLLQNDRLDPLKRAEIEEMQEQLERERNTAAMQTAWTAWKKYTDQKKQCVDPASSDTHDRQDQNPNRNAPQQ